MSFPILTILPVGQGNCSLIEVYNHDPKEPPGATLEFLAMVDCGVITRASGGMDTQNITESKKYIKEKMNKRWLAKNGKEKETAAEPKYYLDCFLLTHQDNDHWSILSQILNEILDKNIQDNIWYAIGEKPEEEYFYRCKTSNVINYKKVIDIGKETEQIEQIYQIINIPGGEFYVNQLSIYKIMKKSTENYCIELDYTINLSNPKILKSIKFDFNSNDWEIWINLKKSKIWECLSTDNNGKFISNLLEKFEDKKFKDANKSILEYLIKQSYIYNKKFWGKDWKNEFVEISFIKLDSYIISKFYYGGIQYGPTALGFRYLVDLLAESKNNFAINPGHTVSFDTSGKKEIKFTVLSRLDDLSIIKSTEDYIFEAESGSNISILRNASSAVTLWEVCGQKYLMTGDATAHTFYYLINNDVALKESAACQGCIMTAPHHGSDHTSKGKYKSSKKDLDILDTFMKTAQPASVVVSAGHQSMFQHPGATFVTTCICNLGMDVESHFVYEFGDRVPESECFYVRKKPVYTTVTGPTENVSTLTEFRPAYAIYQFKDTSTTPIIFQEVQNDDMKSLAYIRRERKNVDKDTLPYVPLDNSVEPPEKKIKVVTK